MNRLLPFMAGQVLVFLSCLIAVVASLLDSPGLGIFTFLLFLLGALLLFSALYGYTYGPNN